MGPDVRGHFDLLLWPSEEVNPSRIVQSLKERTAQFVLSHLRQTPIHPRCGRMLGKLALPETVHRVSTHRAWQRRFYDLNVWSDKKHLEKLDSMHANPVKRGMVSSADQWPWSSFRFYYLEDSSLLTMDHLP